VDKDGREYLEIEISGIVQGVGFRPFVYRLAGESGIAGSVVNTPDGVRIEAAADPAGLHSFLGALREQAPPQAVIEDIGTREIPAFAADSFEIKESSTEGRKHALISPDLATCDDCLRELLDHGDRRYRYPFINCTNCGPRFTIIGDTPYDRPLTTMATFVMCEECEKEYHDPADRRFHAQPNACPVCGPRLWLTDSSGEEVGGDPIALAAASIREGGIVALKGLGGFHLACDATCDGAVSRLRERKRRYAKPLAVMVADLEEAEKYCRVSAEEAALLTSPRRPIVLLLEREGSRLSREVAPGLRHQGLFLPYTPLHHLLLQDVGTPLVMTSGNVSEEPIARDNDEALRRLVGIADRFILHDRGILVRYDDSVTRVMMGMEYPIRRARGYAPYPVKLAKGSTVEVLALGAEQKNTFCFLRGKHAFVGQHIGDMDSREAREHYEEAMEAVRRLFTLSPQLVAHDLHPEYMTTQLAGEYGLPCVGVQHHHAHIVSCMADNDLEGKVIGVSWDGTGYGPDGSVWGGEFLVCDEDDFMRAAHLSTYPMPGGEVCIKELQRMAFGVLWEVCSGEAEAVSLFGEIFAAHEGEAETLAAQIKSGFNTPLTSSAGRVFDAAAALIGLRSRAFYEGQAACELEAVAKIDADPYPYRLDVETQPWQVDTHPLFTALLEDVKKGVGRPEMAGAFHTALAGAIVETCRGLSAETGIDRVALSGGVFQNELLTKLVVEGLEEEGMAPYLHRRVPCNDGGISLGQAVSAARRFEKRGLKREEEDMNGIPMRVRNREERLRSDVPGGTG
jgi:hydrogenase maturation protein HypF